MFVFALRHDAIPRNPVEELVRCLSQSARPKPSPWIRLLRSGRRLPPGARRQTCPALNLTGKSATSLRCCRAAPCARVRFLLYGHAQGEWDWSVAWPSAPTTLAGIGIALGATAWGIALAQGASLLAVPVLALVGYWAWRWIAGLRYRWTRASGLL